MPRTFPSQPPPPVGGNNPDPVTGLPPSPPGPQPAFLRMMKNVWSFVKKVLTYRV